jgi:hypothetical protein
MKFQIYQSDYYILNTTLINFNFNRGTAAHRDFRRGDELITLYIKSLR